MVPVAEVGNAVGRHVDVRALAEDVGGQQAGGKLAGGGRGAEVGAEVSAGPVAAAVAVRG